MRVNSDQQLPTRWRRVRFLAGWGLCVLPVIALADAPMATPGRHSHPAATATDQENGGTAAPAVEPPDLQLPRPRMGPGNFGMVTSQDWDKATQWMEDNAPKRWAYFQSIRITNSREADRDFRDFVVPRIRQIKWLEQSNKALFDLRMQRVHLEDAAFGMLQNLTAATDSDKKSKLTESLKQKLGEMYDNTMAERQLRIVELDTFLQNEKKQLADDQQSSQKDKHVEKTLKRVLETGSLDAPPHENNPRENGSREGGMRLPRGTGPMASPATQPTPGS